MPTPSIFDFSTDGLADGDTMSVDLLLSKHPKLYVNHLTMALGLERWRERARAWGSPSSEEFNRGVDWVLGDVIAHLRQGDYLPRGAMLAQGEPSEDPAN